MKFSNWKIAWQLGFVVVLPILGMAGLVANNVFSKFRVQSEVVAPTTERVLREDVEREIQSLVLAKASFLAKQLEQYTTDEEKRQAIIELTDDDRWYDDQSGYYFAYDMDGVRINVPTLEGEQKSGLACIDLEDKKGVRFIEEMVADAKEGGGFCEYYFPKNGVVTAKLSYVAPITGTDYFVGTGRYIDDIDAQSAAVSEDVTNTIVRQAWAETAVSLLVVLLILGLAVAVTRGIAKRLQRSTLAAQATARGELNGRLEMTERDEIGDLGRALDTAADMLEHKAEVAQAIADGDLKVRVPLASPGDVLGHALNNMTESLNDMVRRIKATASQVAHGAYQLQTGSRDLSESTTAQAAHVEEIASSVTELGGQTTRNAENTREVQRLAKSSTHVGHEGNQKMGELAAAMDEITRATEKITQIIKTIDDIAFQTNLLALNAAVEAARAGQHGKGFAVVAEEVRNLAGRSAKASQETADLIHRVVSQIEGGNVLAQETATMLRDIVEHATKVERIADEVAMASNEQAASVGEINKGLRQIEQVTHQNSGTAEETASASQEMTRQAEIVDQLVARFQLRDEQTESQAADARNERELAC